MQVNFICLVDHVGVILIPGHGMILGSVVLHPISLHELLVPILKDLTVLLIFNAQLHGITFKVLYATSN